MTLMAAEAGTSAVEGEAADATVAGRRAAERRRTPPKPGGRTGGRTQQGTQAYVPRSKRQPAKPTAARRVASKAGPEGAAASKAAGFVPTGRQRARPRSQREQQIRRGGRKAVAYATKTNYRTAIVVELMLALLLAATTPFARKNQGQVSPFSGQDILKLVAIMLVYLLLAAVSGFGQTAARLAAWFGGLILLAIGLGETAGLVHTLAIFGGSNAAPPAATAATVQKNLPNSSTVNANPVGGSAETGIPSRGSQQDAEPPPSASGSGSG